MIYNYLIKHKIYKIKLTYFYIKSRVQFFNTNFLEAPTVVKFLDGYNKHGSVGGGLCCICT